MGWRIAPVVPIVAFLVISACEQGPGAIRQSEPHMGTTVTITVADGGHPEADLAISEAFAEFRRIDQMLSTHRGDSEISRLNRDKVIDNPSPELVANLRKALSYSRLAEGAFDVTVQPILDLYEQTLVGLEREPTPDEIALALEKVDYRTVRVSNLRIEIGANQEITLGGIAKGYAVDSAAAVLRTHGIADAIVEAGGDLRVMGRKTEGKDWHIAIQNPRDSNDFIARLAVPNRAVLTSGDYQQFFDAERTYHHIINPLTGYSATQLISVTVIAKDAFDADALSTTVFVMGAEAGLQLIESLDGAEAMFITRSRRIHRSSGWAAYELEM